MKRIFFVTCLMAFALMVSAQDNQRRGGFQMTPEQLTQYYADMKKDVGLTDAKVASIKKIEEEFRTKQREAMEKAGGDRDKMREERTKLTTERNAAVKKVISADEFKKYEAFIAQRMQRRNN